LKVASPVGDFPFTLERIAVEGRALVIHGRMGAWPSRIDVVPSDLPQVAKAAAPLLAPAALAVGVVALRRRRRR
jgi:hypothetical protein